ncbi:hypothetical protein H5410_045714 [Solanum commersonii]|uniref:Uncharacterized protein n=1 Tax=Solanum commersonii TaxID=4109 RepID=A0A9J5XEG6_SOLCO|nr:hypothetical protein H5410_045714 [Solanum commersonii]
MRAHPLFKVGDEDVEDDDTVVDEEAKGFTIECCDYYEYFEDEDIKCDKDVSSPDSEFDSTISSNRDLGRPLNNSKKRSSWISIPFVVACPLGCAYVAMSMVLKLAKDTVIKAHEKFINNQYSEKVKVVFKRHTVVVENVNPIVDEVAKCFTVECYDDDWFVEAEDILCDSLNDESSVQRS